MLHARRTRIKKAQEEESRGEAVWTKRFDQAARTKIQFAAEDSAPDRFDQVAIHARKLILRDEGKPFLTELGVKPALDLVRYLTSCRDDMVPTVIEALLIGVVEQCQWTAAAYPGRFVETVNETLNEHRISFEFLGAGMVEFESRELHQEVVAPTLTLLAGREGWGVVESAYHDALHEIAEGHPQDAITDVARALQEALTLLDCEGNTLGALLRSARQKSLLGPHDSVFTAGVEKMIDWVSADRSETGEAHKLVAASRDDAWFTVHVVGALILRLTGPGGRG